ncbi:MAG TPA: hypothetical protein VFL04_03495 [Rectinemataceae bacterium]|nr:hypothetical protein [Rectinemataceae bacterium]
MEVLYCDVCKKAVENPIPQRSFFHYADIEICEPCRDELNLAVKYTVRGKKPFDYSWFNELELKILRDGVARGKISPAKR